MDVKLTFVPSKAKQVLLLLPLASYRNEDFLAAADKLGVTVITAADNCSQLAGSRGIAPMHAVHFDQPEEAAHIIHEGLAQAPDAVLAVEDHGLEVAARLREAFGLPGNGVAAVEIASDKFRFRQLLRRERMPCPDFQLLPDGADPLPVAASVRYPAVVKARRLSASRGVVRVDDANEFFAAVEWVRRIQAQADRAHRELGVVIESFIPGNEYALEGLLTQGELKVLALFDKPDPLDGPYFEETLYVTPSRLPQSTQQAIVDAVAQACRAAGLTSGPIHAEARVNDQGGAHGVWLLEVAPRSIGGLCGRMLRTALGMSLEEVVLRHALGEPVPEASARGASGVMMIPIPKRGIYRSVSGMDAARAVPGIADIQIAAEPGQRLLPVPEGASYLGFIFAHAVTPAEVETALREAHRHLSFDIQTEVPVDTVGT